MVALPRHYGFGKFDRALSFKGFYFAKAITCCSYEHMSDPKTDIRTGEPMPKPNPAATLVIFRDKPTAQSPDILIVERSSKMAFAGGAAVFPGGRVDAADFDFAKTLGHDDVDEYGARIAAIRESIEETGVAVAVDGDLSAGRVIEARAALHSGTVLSDICEQYDWKLELDKLVPFARWCPPFREKRVFDTRFYMVSHDDHDVKATVDETENYNLFWSGAQNVLDMAGEGKVKIIFPTKRNLERLAQFSSFEEAAAHSRKFPVELVSPTMEKRDGVMHLCIPEGIGYPVTSESMEDVQRGFQR